MINWDKNLDSAALKRGAYALWSASCTLFLIGIDARFPAEPSAVDALVVACILFAQINSLLNFHIHPTVRHLSIIGSTAVWAIAFMLRRNNCIHDDIYALVIGSFVLTVVSRP